MTLPVEREILQKEVERLTAEGFDVFIEPGPSLSPVFIKGYRPDAVAIGNGRKIALEVASRSGPTDRKLSEVAALFSQHPEWEFRIIWVEPADSAPRLPIQTKDQIRAIVGEIKKLRGDQYFRPSFLLAWAAFEAAARAIAESQLGRPQTPGRIVQVLGQEGYLSPNEADEMRALIEKRNRLVHGTLDVKVTGDDVDRLVHAIEIVTAEIGE
ncbi:HepT-like ribonuclease domain-containing protein [Mesorhizobium sp. ORS 3428]|uniref:HepT-like ribonuclease domain-containing protein n=1 Tax=Mesorhizobium sp. ORS 3428 TaxID=540997 RepID=UPI0008DA4F7F|nr:HepT-like ribonuclease domain-containing protein [Mesorhizobium sp. ORS 3428]OHV89515.1 hypothetical protein ORS3428_14840 [Mesorhizobium sp. ORS 3428]